MEIKAEEDYLMLSGIQHFDFCKRQWALIHIEQQWEENVRTIEGQYLHRNVDQPFFKEKRGDKYTVRALKVVSHTLKITGVCDVVEFVANELGVFIPKLNGKFQVYPVEYKRGKPKQSEVDILQLTAQAMCLEEMLMCKIDKGYIFYDEIKRRQEINLSDELRRQVKETVKEMQTLFMKKHTPKVKTGNWCKSCSMKNICLPELLTKESASAYMARRLAE